MSTLIDQVGEMADAIHEARVGQARLVVALSGAPGVGKSTLAAEVAKRLNVQKCSAIVVPQDGFHLDNRLLEHRNLLQRKGSPASFDSAGFLHLVRRLKTPAGVVFPIFDRAKDIAIAGAGHVPAECQVVIVEGNYVLLDEAPWSDLAPLWDLTVSLHLPLPDLRARLIQRWLDQGLSRAAATRRAEQNDIPNAERVSARELPADIVL
ncbi:sugar transporter [Aestuariibius sp. HNIBRBA575]|uniref:sugar transporter n=1 Tax=Aestuariibius sp. HNIBRBA575 TaxID=3233343 RepID=UPI0034A3A5D7